MISTYGSKYDSDNYLIALAAITLNKNDKFKVVTLPPASGKSYLIALIALYYI